MSEDRVAALERCVSEQSEEIAGLRLLVEQLTQRVAALERPAGSRATPSSQPRPRSATAAAAAHSSTARRASPPSAARAATAGTKRSPRPSSASSSSSSASARRSSGPDAAVSSSGVRYRPLRGCVFPPSEPDPALAKRAAQPPTARLELEFVYGYRGKDCRDNLLYTPEGDLLYFTAGVGVVYDRTRHAQRHFVGHDNDIMCMALCPTAPVVATGQQDPPGVRDAYVLLWDHHTMRQVQLLDNAHKRGVSAMAFTPDGSRLLTIGADDAHTLNVWDWHAGKRLASQPTHKDHVFSLQCNPVTGQAVLAGRNAIKFIDMSHATDGRVALRVRTGITGDVGSQQAFLSLAFTPSGMTLAGCYSGEIYIWRENYLVGAVAAHQGPVYALASSPLGVLSGGRDGILCVWDASGLTPEAAAAAPAGGAAALLRDVRRVRVGDVRIRALHCRDGEHVAVGTLRNEILEVAMGGSGGGGDGDDGGSGGSGGALSVRLIMRGHAAELWGLAAHPDRPLVATASDDGTVYVMSTETRAIVSTVPLPAEVVGKGGPSKGRARCVAWSPDGARLAVGLDGCVVAVFDVSGDHAALVRAERLRERAEGAVQVLRFSPDGAMLAMGTSDGAVEVAETAHFGRLATLRGHSSVVTSMDWSLDGAFLRSTSSDYELLFWDVRTARQVSYASDMRDVAWATHTALLGWGVMGVWPRESDGTDVNAVARANEPKGAGEAQPSLLVSGDDFGNVTLFNYPACVEHAPGARHMGHCAHVTNVTFSHDDRRVISTGGNDATVMQWRVVA